MSKDISSKEYRKKLQSFKERAKEVLERGENPDFLLKEAEFLLQLRSIYPEVFQDFEDIEVMVGDLLSLKERQKFPFGG